MKKIYTLLVILVFMAFSTALFSQDTLKPIGWITYPSDVNWSVDKFEKNAVTIKKAPAEWTFDAGTFVLSEIWDKLGDENEIKNNTRSEGGDLYQKDVFGSTWKAFYDNEFLYVCLKYVDVNQQVPNENKGFEICFQTKYRDRYEPGWQKAQSIQGKNKQYARYLQLGGGKTRLVATPSGATIDEFNSSNGTAGTWENNAVVLTSLGDPGNEFFTWEVDGDNTVWAMVRYSFTDHMYYLTDEFAEDEESNRTAFNPADKDTISWEVKNNASNVTDSEIEYWWNSNVNDAFEAIYYNGYLIFGTGVWGSTGIHEDNGVNHGTGVYLTGKVLHLKGLDRADLTVYSLLGQHICSAENVSELDLSGLNRGLYMVKIGNQSRVYKIVIR
jgi:hypothetical protein